LIKSVLIVDDDEDILDILEDKLSKFEFNIVKSRDGKNALLRIDNRKFDLIITDIDMPRKDGVSLLEDIRKRLLNRDTPVIILSGELDADKVKKIAKCRAFRVLVKPLDDDKFNQAIRECTGSY